MSQLAVPSDSCRSVSLKVLADGLVSLAKKGFGVGCCDLGQMVRSRQWVPVQEVAASSNPVQSDLVSAKNQAGVCVPRVANPGKVAPGASGIAGVHTDAIAMNAARWF